MSQNIYITGFMGAGKTRAGKLLARKLGRRFSDTDSLIEQQTQMTITEIFDKQGEPFFRELEAKMISDLSQKTGLVVSLGGGAILNPRTRQIISQGIWVFINTSFDIIKKRVMNNPVRPLAKDPSKLKELYEQRLPLYKLAPIIVDCEGDSESEMVCQTIIQRIIHDKKS